MTERKAMIKAGQGLSVSHQCRLSAVPRSSVYARGIVAADLELMRQSDALYLQWPFYGSRRVCDELQQRGQRVNRKRVQRLMRQMGLRAVYPKPRTSQPGKGHTIYPYLLRGLSIERPNQVWDSDTCYIPMAKGFMYLTVIMDWASRRVLAWRISNTLEADACVDDSKKPCCVTGLPRSLTRTRAPNTPVRPSQQDSKERGYKSVWTAKADGSTMCLSNG